MRTILIPGLWYLLPDDTPVKAVLLATEWWLVTSIGTPLFAVVDERVFRLDYTSEDRQYHPHRCDLVVDDLRLTNRDPAPP